MIGTLEQVLSNEAEACFLLGDCVARMGELPAGSVHAVITSPPYWNLIDYKHEDQLGHEKQLCCPAVLMSLEDRAKYGMVLCGQCFVCHLILVCRGVRRVLREDGSFWLNVGDSYASVGGHTKQGQSSQRVGRAGIDAKNALKGQIPAGLKQKDLCLTQFLVARALQMDGWYVRSMFPWVKRNPIPESATDRPSKTTEYVFILTKSPRYFFDRLAVARYSSSEPSSLEEYEAGRQANANGQWKKRHTKGTPEQRNWRTSDPFYDSLTAPHGLILSGDEILGVDTTVEVNYAEHFASFPQALIEPFVRASTPERGCCVSCGAPWVRVIKEERKATRPGRDSKANGAPEMSGNRDPKRHVTEFRTMGWEPACDCYGLLALPEEEGPERTAMLERYIGVPTNPALILDPFSGTATTSLVASLLGRRSVGIELSPEFLEAGRMRFARRGKVTKADAAKNKAAAEGKPSGFSSLGLI